MKEDIKWMEIAIKEALFAQSKGEVPVGAILVKNNCLIAKSHNSSITNNDPTAHAEINLIRKAGILLNNYRLNDTTLYVTLEPCAMCFGAMMHARIKRLVYGAYDLKTGVCGSCDDLQKAKFFNHHIHVDGGILETENQNILKDFFKKIRLTKK
jgi:tRNA(adenine34) deaminase